VDDDVVVGRTTLPVSRFVWYQAGEMYACGPWKTTRASTSRKKSRHTGLPRAHVTSQRAQRSRLRIQLERDMVSRSTRPGRASPARQRVVVDQPAQDFHRVSSKWAGTYIGRLGRLARARGNRGGGGHGRLLAPRLARAGALVPLRGELGHEVR